MCRTRPITRPSKTATPSVPGALSGKVRRHVMLGSVIAMPALAVIAPQRWGLEASQ